MTILKNNGDAPYQKIGASLVYYNNCFYIFGYTWPESSSNINDTNIYEYNISANYWSIINAKSAHLSKRVYHSSVIYNDSMILLYGMILENNTQLFDIWKFNFTLSEWMFLLNVSNQANEIAYNSEAYVMIGSIFYSLFGRTALDSLNSIYYIDFSKENPSPVILTNNQYTPTKRINHCSVIINDIMFIVGGLSNSGAYLNDVWRFYLSNNTWSYDSSSGDTPSGRELFGCTIYGNLIIIFGGTDSTTKYNDVYSYEITLQIWNTYEWANSITGRYNLCIVQYNYYTIIIGGTDDLVIFDEIWAINYLSKAFSLINANDFLKFQFLDFKCFTEFTDISNNIYAIGGRSSNYQPDNNIYKIQIIDNGNSLITNTSIALISQYNIPSESSIIYDGYFIYILFGSILNKILSPNILAIDLDTQDQYILTVNSSVMLFGHSAVHYKEFIYVFGGGFSVGTIKLPHSASNILYKFNTNTNDRVNFACSAGTIYPNCTPCPSGTYYNSNICTPCPKGKFSTAIASTSEKLCVPCGYGYFSSEIGATYCIDCPKNSYCPIGSSIPITKLKEFSFESNQPQAYSRQTNYISTLVSNIWYSIFGLCLLITIIVASIKCLWENIYRFDIFVKQHDNPLNKPVLYRKTKIGGIFTLFSILGVSVLIIGAFLSFQLDNITEIKSLVPITIIDTPISASKLIVTVAFYIYGGKCIELDLSCKLVNNFIESGFHYTSKIVSCQLISTDCIVNIEYHDVSLEASISTISILMREETASANSISISINCSSSIPSELSSAFIPIYTDSENEIFIGSLPTIVEFDLTSSVLFI